jgi:hypothetical protein
MVNMLPCSKRFERTSKSISDRWKVLASKEYEQIGKETAKPMEIEATNALDIKTEQTSQQQDNSMAPSANIDCNPQPPTSLESNGGALVALSRHIPCQSPKFSILMTINQHQNKKQATKGSNAAGSI